MIYYSIKKFSTLKAFNRINIDKTTVLASPYYNLPKNKIVCTIGPKSYPP